MVEYPLNDQIGSIELIDYMGNDLSIVNDARASFDRISSELNDKDVKLINYLVKHNHGSTLRGVAFKFRVKAPLFICRQWWKHVIASNHNDEQLQHNEKSYRYVTENNPEFYVPEIIRKQSKSNKQASEGALEATELVKAKIYFEDSNKNCVIYYNHLLDMGVAKEQARMVLPPALYTTWVWTASLQAVLNFIDLRDHENAQWEIQQYAQAVKRFIEPIVPETIKAWKHSKKD